MKYYLSICILFFTNGCNSSPEVSTSKEIQIKEKIQNNKSEAQKAKDIYLKLQKQRSQE